MCSSTTRSVSISALRLTVGVSLDRSRAHSVRARPGRPCPGAEPRSFAVEGYLAACGRRFVQTFTPEAFLCLSESIDRCEVDPGSIRAAATVVGIRGDRLVTPAEVAALAGLLGAGACHLEIESEHGHDGFLLEIDALTPVIRGALAVEVAR